MFFRTGCNFVKSYAHKSDGQYIVLAQVDDGIENFITAANAHGVVEFCELSDGCYNVVVGMGKQLYNFADPSRNLVTVCNYTGTLPFQARICSFNESTICTIMNVIHPEVQTDMIDLYFAKIALGFLSWSDNASYTITRAGSSSVLFQGSLVQGTFGLDILKLSTNTNYTLSVYFTEYDSYSRWIFCGSQGMTSDQLDFTVSHDGCQFIGLNYGSDDDFHSQQPTFSPTLIKLPSPAPSIDPFTDPPTAPPSCVPSLTPTRQNSVYIEVFNVSMIIGSDVPLPKQPNLLSFVLRYLLTSRQILVWDVSLSTLDDNQATCSLSLFSNISTNFENSLNAVILDSITSHYLNQIIGFTLHKLDSSWNGNIISLGSVQVKMNENKTASLSEQPLVDEAYSNIDWNDLSATDSSSSNYHTRHVQNVAIIAAIIFSGGFILLASFLICRRRKTPNNNLGKYITGLFSGNYGLVDMNSSSQHSLTMTSSGADGMIDFDDTLTPKPNITKPFKIQPSVPSIFSRSVISKTLYRGRRTPSSEQGNEASNTFNSSDNTRASPTRRSIVNFSAVPFSLTTMNPIRLQQHDDEQEEIFL